MPTLLKNLTVDEIRDVLLSARTDICMDYGEKSFHMYLDEGSAVAFTDECHIFSTWGELLAAPVFWGRTLPEVCNDLFVYW